MKRTSLLIATSLAANAALIGYIAVRTASPSSGYASHPASSPTASARPSSATSAKDASTSPQLPASVVPAAADAPPLETWKRLQSADLSVFTANLRAAGLPDRQIRMLINAEINDRFRAREEALRPPQPERKYWENRNNYYTDTTTLEQRLAQLDLRREKNALRRELLGDTPPAANDDNPVPVEKRDLLRQVNEDYDTMISQIQREARGIALPSDEEKIRYLREEKAAELKTVLTPGELQEYEMRSSQTANSLRYNLSAFGPTEQEFRTVFGLQKQFDDQFATQPADPTPEYWKQRQEAQKALDAQLAQQLGADRYRDYTRAKDYEYRNLSALTDRLSLPKSTATQIYDLRYSVPSDALQIVRSPDLTPEAKQESLKAIAKKTRDQLTAQLGSEAAAAYLKRHGQWIKSLDQGNVTEYKTDGSQQTHSIPR
ncbi:hypothetical protein [Rariglobus hedericola]|uniref:Lipase helper protein n=1 Tax=Rariglobus hedericola TaxID=2597822 RepID=A0A556QK62_9BACT|nr:hypothetical protein [Rariglobus hedericola]TSJ77034.1 hypothetical protein FPL22_13060 [Rariglobus hedericola]